MSEYGDTNGTCSNEMEVFEYQVEYLSSEVFKNIQQAISSMFKVVLLLTQRAKIYRSHLKFSLGCIIKSEFCPAKEKSLVSILRILLAQCFRPSEIGLTLNLNLTWPSTVEVPMHHI
jgi:hypothetical protein